MFPLGQFALRCIVKLFHWIGPANRGGRDLRIDLARGAALLIIFIDHVSSNPLGRYTLRAHGYIDASDVFVFLSGFSLGLVYTRAIERSGHRACLEKALRRCRTLYVAHLATAAGLALLFLCCWLRGSFVPDADVSALLAHPWTTLISLITLVQLPHLLGILPLCLLLTLLAPFALYGLAKRPRALVSGSLAVYLLVQCFPAVALPSFPEEPSRYFNVFAWQFSFILSLMLGRTVALGKPLQALDNRWLVAGAAAALGYFFLEMHAREIVRVLYRMNIDAADFFSRIHVSLPENQKSIDHPLRLLNLLAFIIVGRLASKGQWLKNATVFRPLILCGQNSLVVFVAGVILSEFVNASRAASSQQNAGFWVLINSVGIAILCMVAAIHSLPRASQPRTAGTSLSFRGMRG